MIHGNGQPLRIRPLLDVEDIFGVYRFDKYNKTRDKRGEKKRSGEDFAAKSFPESKAFLLNKVGHVEKVVRFSPKHHE